MNLFRDYDLQLPDGLELTPQMFIEEYNKFPGSPENENLIDPRGFRGRHPRVEVLGLSQLAIRSLPGTPPVFTLNFGLVSSDGIVSVRYRRTDSVVSAVVQSLRVTSDGRILMAPSQIEREEHLRDPYQIAILRKEIFGVVSQLSGITSTLGQTLQELQDEGFLPYFEDPFGFPIDTIPSDKLNHREGWMPEATELAGLILLKRVMSQAMTPEATTSSLKNIQAN